jgi:hypothetical protein
MDHANPLGQDFTLWLEFEEVDLRPWDATSDFCNMQVTLVDGRRYAFNVWTYSYFERARNETHESAEELHGAYIMPPDLFVDALTRTRLEEVIAQLIKTGQLPAHLQIFDNDSPHSASYHPRLPPFPETR